jgi:hypothetical protein
VRYLGGFAAWKGFGKAEYVRSQRRVVASLVLSLLIGDASWPL